MNRLCGAVFIIIIVELVAYNSSKHLEFGMYDVQEKRERERNEFMIG